MRGLTKAFLVCAVPGLLLALPPGAWAINAANATATLLPDENILVTGGSSTIASPGILNTATLIDTARGSFVTLTNGMSVARASHTATLLPNGDVLIAGGACNAGATGCSSSNGNVTATAEIYNPVGRCWYAPSVSGGAVPAMSEPRYDHTATLLSSGTVLICGGQDNATPTENVWSTCEIFTPSASLPLPANDTSCTATSIGSFGSPFSMTATNGRTGHTATLLSDGRVFIAGGYNPNDSYLQTTEIFDPNAAPPNYFTAASGLDIPRAYHTATLLGDDQVLVAGGMATESVQTAGPGGYLSGAEICPPDGSCTPAAPLNERKAYHTATLMAGGEAIIFGGLGNITTTYVSASGALQTGSTVTFNSPCAMPSACADFPMSPDTPEQILSYNLNFSQLSATLGVPATGRIVDGYVLFSSASISFASGTVVFGFQGTNPPGSDGGQGTSCANLQGAGVCLAGVPVTCNASGVCGQIVLNNISISAMSDTTMSGTSVCSAGGCGTIYLSTTPVGVDPKGVGGAVPAYIDLAGQTYSVTIATIVINSMVFGDQEQYSPSANTWSLAQRFAESYSHAAVLRPDNTIAIEGGLTCSGALGIPPCGPSDQNADIDNMPFNFGHWQGGPTLTTQRANHTSTLLPSGNILTAGGQNDTGMLGTAEILNTANNTVSATGSLNYPRSLHTAALLVNGNVLVAGGQTVIGGSTQTTSTAEVYYPAMGSWGVTGSMNQARQNHAMVQLADGRVLAAGGDQLDGSYLDSAEIYTSTTGTWSTAAPMPYSAANLSLTLLRNGNVLAVGGLGAGGAVGNASIYIPASNTWSTTTKPLPGGLKLFNHRATLLADGRVLVSGGNNGGGESTTSLIYDPNSNTWTTAGALVYPRFGHTAVALPDGDVWVIGGAQGSGVLQSFERFDTLLQSWSTSTYTLSQARAYETAILAPNGYVYAIGGSGGGSTYLSSTEMAYFSESPDASTPGAPPSQRQPSITSSDATPFLPGNSFTLNGTHFHGVTEASSGGGGGANSFFYGPRLVIQSLGGSDGAGSQGGSDFTIDLSSEIYYGLNYGPTTTAAWSLSDSSLTAVMGTAYNPAQSANTVLPLGWYQIRAGANAQFSAGYIIQAGPAKPTATPLNISGSALTATAIQWTWNPVSPPNPATPIDGYDVYDSSTGVWLSTVAVSASPSYLQTNAFPGSANSIEIAAYTLSGDGPLANSPSVITPTATFTCSAGPGQVCGIILPQESSNFTGTLGNGRLVQLTAPAGAFSTSYSSISVVASVPSPAPSCANGTAVVVQLQSTFPANNIQPIGELQLVLSYLTGDLSAPPSQYLLMRVDSSNQCHPVPTTINASENIVTATIDQLATYQLAQATPASTLGPVQIYPNPFYPARAPAMTFANLPSGARLRLFTTRGILILDVNAGTTGTYLWNGNNASGQSVASGLYLAVIESNGSQQIHKVVILR